MEESQHLARLVTNKNIYADWKLKLPLSVCSLMKRNIWKDFIIYLNWQLLIYLFQDNSLNKRKFIEEVI